MRPLILKTLVLVFLVSVFQCAMANNKNYGISMGISTRLIFHSDEKRISIPVINKNSEKIIFHGIVLDNEKKLLVAILL